MRTLACAASLQQPVLAVHISLTEEEARRFRDYWTLWGDHLPLGIVTSPTWPSWLHSSTTWRRCTGRTQT